MLLLLVHVLDRGIVVHDLDTFVDLDVAIGSISIDGGFGRILELASLGIETIILLETQSEIGSGTKNRIK